MIETTKAVSRRQYFPAAVSSPVRPARLNEVTHAFNHRRFTDSDFRISLHCSGKVSALRSNTVLYRRLNLSLGLLILTLEPPLQSPRHHQPRTAVLFAGGRTTERSSAKVASAIGAMML